MSAGTDPHHLSQQDRAALDFLMGRRWAASATVILGMMSAIMASTMINVALPDIMGAFGVGQDTAHWLSTGFLSAMTVSMLLNAWLVGRLGPRLTFQLAVAVFCGVAFIGQFATTIEAVIFSRVVQGACAGLLQPLAMTIMYAAFGDEQRGKAMGIFGMGIVLGPALGPTIGGLIVDHSSWRWTFPGALPLMIVAFLLASVSLPTRMPGAVARPVNWLSLGLIVTAVVSLLVSLSHGQRDGWDSVSIVFGFLLAAVSLLAFIAWEMVTARPLLQIRLFANPAFVLASLVGFTFGVGFFGSIYVLPLFVREVQHFTATKAGLFLMPAGLILVLIFPLAGRIAQHVAARGPICFGFFVFGITLLAMGDADANTSLAVLLFLAVVGRGGLGFVMPPLSLHGLTTLSPQLLPYGAGTMNFVRMLGGAIGVNAIAVLLERQTDYHRDVLATTQTAANPVTAELMQRLNELLMRDGHAELERTIASMGYLRQTLVGQATTIAYQEAFIALGVVFLVGLIPAAMMRRVERAPQFGTPAIRPAPARV